MKRKKKKRDVIMMTDGASAQVAPEEYRLSAVGTNETHKARGPPRLNQNAEGRGGKEE